MAVTKQTYTASATWTAAGAATLFEDAFIDAGLMTAWHDSFADGALEHRVLEIEYDGTKTYGTCYYWFIFTTSAVFVTVASGWGTNAPTGTEFLDYFSTATNTTANHIQYVGELTTATDLQIIRYTSAVNGDFSWFALRNGAGATAFTITPASAVLSPWIDLDKVLFHHFIQAVPTISGTGTSDRATMAFFSYYMLRRSFYAQGSLRGRTNANQYRLFVPTIAYGAFGNSNNSTSNNSNYAVAGRIDQAYRGILPPYGFNNSNPEYTSDFLPVLNGYTYSLYTTTPMPTDFGIQFDYGSSLFSFGDVIVVSAGVEEWEVLAFANNTNVTAASPLLLSRVV
jgi:hypothetical protein